MLITHALALLTLQLLHRTIADTITFPFKFTIDESVDTAVERFCATYSLSIRTCSQVLQTADSLRAKHIEQHANEPVTFAIDVIQDETEWDASARLGTTPLHKLLGMRMMLYLMHGREVLDPRGMLIFPPEVKRVVIDAGAHMCEQTARRFKREPDLGLIAIEPNMNAWMQWPLREEARLIGLPFAVDEVEDLTTLFIPPYDHAASIVQPQPGTFGGQSTTVSVQSIRLERVLRSIPSHLSIVHLKTDCQAKDLQVLQSAGSQLRRVQLIDTEIIFDPHREYAAPASEGSTFDRLLALMRQHEFAFTSCFPAIDPFHPGNISQVDGQFVNLALASKQLVSELRHAGSDWQWDAAVMEKYWDPSVPYEQRHQRNNEQTWEYGFQAQ